MLLYNSLSKQSRKYLLVLQVDLVGEVYFEFSDLSLDLLKSLNAIQDDEQLTPLGFHLAEFPMDPQTGKMILFGAIFGCLDPILSVASSLAYKDAFILPLGKEKLVDQVRNKLAKDSRSDHILMINVMKEWESLKRAHNSTRNFCYDNFLSENVLQMLSNHKKQLADHLYAKSFICSSDPKEPGSNINSKNEDLIRAIICAGLYPNVAKFRKRMTSRPGLFTASDYSVKFHMRSVNCDKPIGMFLLIIDRKSNFLVSVENIYFIT